MAVRVSFEIGHEASLRLKKTNEVFTHDWEVFVRGVDDADISQFVDKIVFQLHDTFPKPKRVVKEPPFSVKESGYAGFTLPIEIHLKNRDEPKKIKFTYDLHLQQSGPPIMRLQKEKYVFQNPSEDFKRKLLKGGATLVQNPNPFLLNLNIEHEKNSRDSFSEDRASQQLLSKPKLSGSGDVKKYKTKEYKEELPRSSNSFENLFGTPIHKTSTISPDPKKPSPNPKSDKRDKEKSHSDRDKQKLKDKEYKDESKKQSKDDKEKLREEKKQKSHKDRDPIVKDKSLKRPTERPISPAAPPVKRPNLHQQPPSPHRVPSPCNKSNSSASSKEEVKTAVKSDNFDSRKKEVKVSENTGKIDKKSRKEKKEHDKDRENKKEHRKDKEPAKTTNVQDYNREIKPKDVINKDTKPPRPINKFSTENFIKDPAEKTKDKSEKERKHKHKKKDKKHNSREKDRDSKDKKHKHDKHKSKNVDIKESAVAPLIDNIREIEKVAIVKNYKEKERTQMTISPTVSLDSSSRSGKSSIKSNKNTSQDHVVEALSSSSTSDSEHSIASDSEDVSFNSENSKSSKPSSKSLNDSGSSKSVVSESPKVDKTSSHKSQKSKDKTGKESKEEKKQRKKKSTCKDDSEPAQKIVKTLDEPMMSGKNNPTKVSSRIDTTKVQDNGVSSSLCDNAIKCESPINGDDPQRVEITPDYMIQLQELQKRIMTIQSNDELDRVVNLIALTGKYEVTKKTFDFDLCSLDRTTVQQLQELIGCESRA